MCSCSKMFLCEKEEKRQHKQTCFYKCQEVLEKSFISIEEDTLNISNAYASGNATTLVCHSPLPQRAESPFGFRW